MMQAEPRIPILVLGLGNVLCSDDGVGVTALHRLCATYRLPEGVLAVDGGTLGLALLPLIERADCVILIDAVRGEGPPGSAVRITGDDVPAAVYERLSPHQIGVADLLSGAAMIGHYPHDVVIVGVVPDTIELGMGCSPAVEASVPALVGRVAAELAARGRAPAFIAGAPAESQDRAIRALGLA
jgi:hydrogenase maturation protease